MRDATLCILVKENQILLGMKKRGFGKGKYNGFGGKVSDNETIEEAALRELHEEVKIKANELEKIAELTFIFPEKKEWDQVVHVFLVKSWDGEPIETEEMEPVWIDRDNIPYDQMWSDDKYWLPLVLQNKYVKARFLFEEDCKTIIDFEMNEM